MKHLLAIAAALLFAAAAAASAGAGGILGSKHDMTVIPTQIGAIAGESSVCVYCHAPHQSSYREALWNKPAISESFQLYTSTTLDGTIAPGMSSTTRMCMSCHDGSVAVYVIVTPPTDGSGYVTGLSGQPNGWNLDEGGFMVGPNVMDHDFRNEHPVSITYDTRDRQLVNPPPSQYPLYAGLVECTSCHNVHDNTYPPFLRTSNNGSRMCLGCHNK